MCVRVLFMGGKIKNEFEKKKNSRKDRGVESSAADGKQTRFANGF